VAEVVVVATQLDLLGRLGVAPRVMRELLGALLRLVKLAAVGVRQVDGAWVALVVQVGAPVTTQHRHRMVREVVAEELKPRRRRRVVMEPMDTVLWSG
jgi:hypothetical protein